MILHWPWWYYCIGCLLAGITAYLLDWLFIIRPLRRDRDRWRRIAMSLGSSLYDAVMPIKGISTVDDLIRMADKATKEVR